MLNCFLCDSFKIKLIRRDVTLESLTYFLSGTEEDFVVLGERYERYLA
jgi:hypothetical protein